MKSARPFDAEARQETARWLSEWAVRGAILEARRATDLGALTEEESARIAVELLWPMAGSGGDSAAGLRPLLEAVRRLAAAV